jgi:hypothetical protein
VAHDVSSSATPFDVEVTSAVAPSTAAISKLAFFTASLFHPMIRRVRDPIATMPRFIFASTQCMFHFLPPHSVYNACTRNTARLIMKSASSFAGRVPPMKSSSKTLAFTVTVLVSSISICGNALAQSGPAEQAVELLKLTLACPVKPAIEADQHNNVTRRLASAEYLGDAHTFKAHVTYTRRTYDASKNAVGVTIDDQVFIAKFSDLESRDRDWFGENANAGELSFLNDSSNLLGATCYEKQQCVTFKDTKSNEATTIHQMTDLTILICDKEFLVSGIAAMKELIKLNSAQSANPNVSNQESKTPIDGTTKNLGLLDITGRNVSNQDSKRSINETTKSLGLMDITGKK